MKTLKLLILAVLFPIAVSAQFSSDLVIYSNTGDAFQLYINNSLVNNYAYNKVLVNDLQSGNYSIQITFQNTYIAPITIIATIPPNTMVSGILQKDNSNQYFLTLTNVILYTSNIPVNNNNYDNHDYHDNHDNHNNHDNNDYNPPANNGYCNNPMTNDNFSTALATIKHQSFDDSKLKLAEQIASSNCLTSAQVKQIVSVFSFESSRLDFAKYAYTRVYDPGNYYIISSAFSFSSSTDELNTYISSLR